MGSTEVSVSVLSKLPVRLVSTWCFPPLVSVLPTSLCLLGGPHLSVGCLAGSTVLWAALLLKYFQKVLFKNMA